MDKLQPPFAPCKKALIQKLWGDFGRLERWYLDADCRQSVIAKWIELPHTLSHPRGWNTTRSTERKLASYVIEANWYQHFSKQKDPRCLMPIGLDVDPNPANYVIVMSDLNDWGLTQIVKESSLVHWKLCLKWLANFHAKHLGCEETNIWNQGTYWHLDTRPDEWKAMPDSDLKFHASAIDEALKRAPFLTLVHGDAKLANFCFSEDNTQVAAVDFQYVGHGCAIKDVILFISSCVPVDQAKDFEELLLDYYFSQFEEAMLVYHPEQDAKQITESWRPFYYLAWADFLRFLEGWSPEHWKVNEYSKACATKGLSYLAK